MIDNKTLRQVVINSKLFPCSGTSYNEVSGSICNFETDLVNPLKTCEVSFTPIQDGTPSVEDPKEITGVSSVNVTSAGANFFDDSIYSDYEQADGSFSGLGSDFNSLYFYIPQDLVGVEVTFSAYIKIPEGSTITNPRVSARVNGTNSNGNAVTSNDYSLSSITFTPTSTNDRVRITYGSNGSQPVQFKEPQLEVGAVVTPFVEYSAPTLTPASLGQTVYNGSLDIISGTGVSDYGYLVLDGSEDWDLYSPQYGFAISIEGMKNGSAMKGYSNFLPTITSSANFGIRFGGASVNNNIYCCRIIGNIEGVTDVETWKTYLSTNNLIICYPLEVPETLTLEPQIINTLEGINNIWNDAGETTVKYAVSGGSCNGIMEFLPIFYPNGKGVKHHGSTF